MLLDITGGFDSIATIHQIIVVGNGDRETPFEESHSLGVVCGFSALRIADVSTYSPKHVSSGALELILLGQLVR